MNSLTTERFLRTKEVLEIVPVSRPTIYRLVEKGQFPKPVRVGSSSLWPEDEIRQWMKNKMETR